MTRLMNGLDLFSAGVSFLHVAQQFLTVAENHGQGLFEIQGDAAGQPASHENLLFLTNFHFLSFPERDVAERHYSAYRCAIRPLADRDLAFHLDSAPAARDQLHVPGQFRGDALEDGCTEQLRSDAAVRRIEQADYVE